MLANNILTKILIISMILISVNLNLFGQRKYAIFNSSTGKKLSMKELAIETSKFDIIFFGEFHDDSLIHALQFEYMSAFFKVHKKTAVSLEMFERDVQVYIDKYLSKKIKEEEFIKKSRPWYTYKEYYRPLVELAKKKKSHVIAANAPRKYASMYARGGMTSINDLPDSARSFIAKEINIVADEYQKLFLDQMLANMGKTFEEYEELAENKKNTLHLYYGAQCVKDETMAESIVNFIKINEKYKIVHFNGDFHSRGRLGTVQKVKDRNENYKIAVITPAYVETGDPIELDESLKKEGDFIMVMEEKPHDPRQRLLGDHLGQNYITSHKITIKLDPANNFLEGTDELKFKNPIIKSGNLTLLKDLKIESVTSEERAIEYILRKDSLHNEIIIKTNNQEISELTIKYSGNVNYPPNERRLNQKHAHSAGIISSAEGEGIYLPAGSFYPYTEHDLAEFTLEVTFPEDLEILTSGKLDTVIKEKGNKVYTFKTEIPTDNLTIVGGRYFITDTIYDGKTFSTYTFEKSELAKKYNDAVIEYYDFYTELFGDYPYSNFTIVENFFATGFGMPGYTLLSNKLMKMPWIVLSPGALAHEFVHNWWGNSIYLKPDRGNWCEALTTFSTNYYYNVLIKNKDKALSWRQKALLSIESLPEESNYPLEDFEFQKIDEDAVIGYQKGAFLFYELYKLIGEEHFFGAMKSFATKYKGKRATWFSMMYTFRQYIKKNELDIPVYTVFNQWLKETEVPKLSLGSVNLKEDSLHFEIKQDQDFYMIVPVKILTSKDTIWEECLITKEVEEFKVKTGIGVKSIEIDPEFQTLRRLNDWEIAFSYKNTLKDNPLVILPHEDSKDYKICQDYVKMLLESDYKVESKSIETLKEEDWVNRSLIVLGNYKSNEFYKNLKGHYPDNVDITSNEVIYNKNKFTTDANLLMLNFSHPKNSDKLVTVLYYDNIDNAEQFRRFSHYSSYSMVLVKQHTRGRAMIRAELYPVKPTNNPLEYIFE